MATNDTGLVSRRPSGGELDALLVQEGFKMLSPLMRGFDHTTDAVFQYGRRQRQTAFSDPLVESFDTVHVFREGVWIQLRYHVRGPWVITMSCDLRGEKYTLTQIEKALDCAANLSLAGE